MGRAGAHLKVKRLLQKAAVRRPKRRELENEVLKRHEADCTICLDMAPHVAKDSIRLQCLLQMHGNKASVQQLELS